MPDRQKIRIPTQPNPFNSFRVGSPWGDGPADVPSINNGPFLSVIQELNEVRTGLESASIVISGEPGSGKTHLLGRIRRTIDEAADGPTNYIYVRCHASAATLWRHVRAAIAGDLLDRRRGISSRLQHILNGKSALDAVRSLNFRRVLECYRDSRHTMAAAAWLRGEVLPESDLAALGIAAEKEDEDRSREMEAKDMVHALLSLLAPVPTIVCFDQVEALETYRGDREGFHTMGALISELYDNHQHLLIISCVVTEFESRLQELANISDRQRWLARQVNLRPIDWIDALRLVKERLDGSDLLASSRSEHPENQLWPLTEQGLKPLFAATGLCLPRTLIQACRTQFEELFTDQTEEPEKLSPAIFLEQEYARNLDRARPLIERQGGDKTLTESLPWLLQNSGASPILKDEQQSRYANLAFQDARGSFAVVSAYSRGNELTGRLRRVDRYWDPKKLGLRIVRDPSVTPGSRGRQLIESLKARGGQEVYPLPEALAALQAIRDMIASARSGDLTHEGHAIGEQEVTQWALSNLPPQLERLRDDFLEHEPADPTLSKLAELLGQRKVVEAEAAARELSLTSEEVSACARRHPMQFGLLAGPPLVLFQAVEGSSPVLSRA